jgi:hypothetical protein
MAVHSVMSIYIKITVFTVLSTKIAVSSSLLHSCCQHQIWSYQHYTISQITLDTQLASHWLHRCITLRFYFSTSTNVANITALSGDEGRQDKTKYIKEKLSKCHCVHHKSPRHWLLWDKTLASTMTGLHQYSGSKNKASNMKKSLIMMKVMTELPSLYTQFS